MNNDELERRTEKLETKAFFWDIATCIIIGVCAILLIKDTFTWIIGFFK